MHSSPIDLLVRAPGQPTSQPSESDSDGRFSELLRQPSDAAAEPPAARPAERPVEAAAEPGQDIPAAADPNQAEPGAVPASGDKAPTSEAFVEAMAVIPEAITHVVPAVPGTEPTAETTAAVPNTAPANSGAAQQPPPLLPVAGTPAGDPTSDTVPTPGISDGQPPVSLGAQTDPSVSLTGSGNGAPQTAQTPIVASAPTPPSSPVEPAAPTNAVDSGSARSVALAPNASIETNPAMMAGNAAASVPVDAAPSNGVAASIQASATATKVPVAPTRSVPAATESSAVPETPELTDGPDPALPATPTASNTAGKTGLATQTSLATTGATAAATSDRPAAMTAQPAARPEAATVELPASSAQQDSPAATTAAQTARPAMETAAPVQSAGNAATPPPASEQVVLQLRRAVADGIDRLTVQLKPASLGRVDVQMEVGHDGRLQAVISAERPETLHMLQRDARALTTALNDAGLQTDSGSLSFNLRGQTGDQAGGNDRLAHDGAPASRAGGADDGDDADAPITLTLGAGRVDIKV